MKRNSIAFNWINDYRLVLAIAALAGIGWFLVVSAYVYKIGFPLDDTWIHLVYARNLTQYGEWAFRIGIHSAGSTSPLWTALLAIGYLIHLAPYAWTYMLGWLALSAMAILAENTARRLVKTYHSRIPWVGLFIALEWHLTWSATSGMETLLHGLIVMIVLVMLMERSRRYLTLGLLAGLSVWVRPDGLTLLGPILFAMVVQEDSLASRGRALVKIAIGFGVLFFPYLAFNLALSGTPMPNTFYAKQAEYAVYWLSKPLMERLAVYVIQITASPFIVLIPGLFLWMNRIVRERNWGALAGLIWSIGYISIYFMHLPAYQHGRYVIPALPILYLLGMIGMMEFVYGPKSNPRIVFIWQALVVLLVFGFQWVGARQNAEDVILIETQMVETAQWINGNLSPDTVLAVHDIGAVGYFTNNPLIDLAGLITPDVVPFIRDETRLSEYIDTTNAQYLVGFPSWYPQLVSGRTLVFKADNPIFTFEDRMSVYRWK